MNLWSLGFAAALALCAKGARAEDCSAQLPAPAALQRAETVADYRPVLEICKGGAEVAIRRMKLGDKEALLLAEPQKLTTRLERAACWTDCRPAADDDLHGTRMMEAIAQSAKAPDVARRSFLHNAGLSHGAAEEGAFFTADLCPSRKPLDRDFVRSLESDEATPVALSISGFWLLKHFDDYRWLLDEQARGRLAITWTNHSYTHPFHNGVAEGENFLLSPGVDPDHEILETEKLLIANGQTPSLFFRFPGLVSSSQLMQAVQRRHLISLGADAWLALGQKPSRGSIILVHVNGNEERGLKIYRRDAADGLLPHPLKPLDEAP